MIYIFLFSGRGGGWVGILRRSKMPVTRRRWNWNGIGMELNFFWGGVGIVRRIIIIIIFFLGGGWVGIVRRSKMPVTRREVKRSSEVGDLRLSCKSYSWNFFFWGGIGIVRRIKMPVTCRRSKGQVKSAFRKLCPVY